MTTKSSTKTATTKASRTAKAAKASKATASRTTSTTSDGFSADERAAMKERAKELRAEAKGAKDRAKGEADLRAKIDEMPEADRVLAEAIHAIVTEHAPQLMPKTWYGMPAYADVDGKAVCFFKAASKFGARYAELGFNEQASLDDGTMWPTVYAITTLSKADEELIATLVAKAVG
ncbi:iron chaperone [Knoellia sp. CPCC 206450]|uniref:iron chaperone n=1 Tax=Knoellia tibetensis TaxID=3404798 RepID=UPI003B433FBD